MPEERQVSDGFKAYEEGKHRRYNLLFAVNGGAFAVAKLFANRENAAILGDLSLHQLSIGMVLLTATIVVDIFMFGEKMRRSYVSDAFGWQGKAVLVLIGVVICAGWLLIA